MTYRISVADPMVEPLTIVCSHWFERVETEVGSGQRCSKCTLFRHDNWWSPQCLIATEDAKI